MTHTHYIAVDVTKDPPEEAKVVTVFLNDRSQHIGFRVGNDWMLKGGEIVTNKVASWLKPCTETGAVDEGKFAEWCEDSSFTHVGDGIWKDFTGSDDPDDAIVKTTSELLEIFKAETQKT